MSLMLLLTAIWGGSYTFVKVGFRDLPVFSVQYHPEASPGPHDANHLFHRFVDLMRRSKGG